MASPFNDTTDDEDIICLEDVPPKKNNEPSAGPSNNTDALNNYVKMDTDAKSLITILKQATSTTELFKKHSLENYAIVKAKDAEIRRLKRIEAKHESECRGGGEDLRRQVEDLEKQLTKQRLKIFQMRNYQKQLRRELKKHKAMPTSECSVCMETQAHVVFVPCKHLACCEACGQKVKECPICRVKIRQRLVAYVA